MQNSTRLHFRNCSTSLLHKKSWQKNHYFSLLLMASYQYLNWTSVCWTGLSNHQKITKLVSWRRSQNIVITSQKARLNSHLSASYCHVFLGIKIWEINCVFTVQKIIPLILTSTLNFIFFFIPSHGLQVSSQWMWMAELSGPTLSLKFSHLGKASCRLLGIAYSVKTQEFLWCDETCHSVLSFTNYPLLEWTSESTAFHSLLTFHVISWQSFYSRFSFSSDADS